MIGVWSLVISDENSETNRCISAQAFPWALSDDVYDMRLHIAYAICVDACQGPRG